MFSADIDIDFGTSFDPIKIFDTWIKASVVQGDKLTPHPCGVYAQNIPTDPISKLAAIPYKAAEDLGYFKIDFLHVSVYDQFQSRAEIEALLKIDPPFELLKSPAVVKQLFQLSKHFQLIDMIKPKSVEELADAIALIRPGKKFMLDAYLKDRKKISPLLYQKTDEYYFKKSHSISYALVIVLQLHLISMGFSFNPQ